MVHTDIATDATGLTPLPLPYPKLAPNVLDLFSLKGKVAAISGSSTGIGWEVARAYAQAGADVAVWYNSHNPEEKVQGLIKETGRKIKCYRVPVTDPDAVEKTIDQIVADFGKLDIFVANAGVPWTSGSLIDVEGHTDWFKVVDLDFNGAMFCAKAAGKHFKKQGSGSMIFTASMSGHIVNIPQLQACYNAAKAGVLHFSRSLAVEWAGFARSNTVSPGYVNTEISNFIPLEMRKKWLQLIPVGRECDPRELVGAYLYLASDASTYTTGADIRVDGAYSCP